MTIIISQPVKNRLSKNPDTIPGVDAQRHDAGMPENEYAMESQDGTLGFEDKISGHGMSGRYQTSSFDAQPQRQKKVHITLVEGGLEENGDKRHPTSGIVGRGDAKFTESQKSTPKMDLYTPFLILQ